MAPPKELAEQYKVYVQDVGNIGNRKDQANRLFISVMSLLLVFLSLTGESGVVRDLGPVLRIAVSLVSILLCVAWYLILRSYYCLFGAKLRILREMEKAGKDLLYNCFGEEWSRLKKNGYHRITQLERALPGLLGMPFFAFVVLELWQTERLSGKGVEIALVVALFAVIPVLLALVAYYWPSKGSD